MKKLLLIFGIFIFSYSSIAATVRWKNSNGELELFLPKNWNILNQNNNRLIAQSDQVHSDQRDVLFIGTVKTDKAQLDPIKLKQQSYLYFEDKAISVKNQDGFLLASAPYSVVNWNHIKNVGKIGVRYIANQTEYSEESFFFSCGKKNQYLLKTLLSTDEKNVNINKLKASIRCR